MGFSEDVRGNQSVQRTIVDRADKTVFHVNYSADSTNEEVSITVNGLSVSNLNRFGAWQVYSHDGLERQTSTVSRTGATKAIGSFTHFNGKGQVDWSQDSTSNWASLVYDPDTGRQIAVSNALGQVTHSEYDIEGRLLGAWGATYPVFYAYDEHGRRTNMFTLRDPAVESLVTNHAAFLANIGSFDRTTWLYDEATGLLTNKVYADSKGPVYSYTTDGKLETRTWARGIVTTYTYTNTTGEMICIDYGDDTPDVTFAFNRLGQQITVTDATGTRNFTYNDQLQLAAETNVTGVLTRQYDNLGRSAGLAVGNNYTIQYGYSEVGRFSSLSSVVASQSNIWNYSYLQGSDLISGWSNGAVEVTKNYETNRDLVTHVKSMAGASLITQFDYSNDALGRRTQRIDTGNATTTNAFGYNNRSELTNALMGANSFDWMFDPIGNRISDTSNFVTHSYAANSLNQYTLITNGGLRTLAHDPDGNLTNDSVFTYTWNGANQLSGVSNSGLNAVYKYDYMSRRYQTVVNGVTNSFLWDEWHLAQEVSDAGVTNTYVWGNDLSGSLQGAGGIGGLLSVTRNGVPYFPVTDANGNITDYLDGSGTVVAHREYDAYGNTLVATGSMVNEFHFWFSSKYLDQETGLYYYGFRFYWPEAGRWLNRDPMQEQMDIHLYGFGRNSPYSNVDHFGLWGTSVHKTMTLLWATVDPVMPLQMPSSGANLIAEMDDYVDTDYPIWPPSDVFWKMHFNRNATGPDSRFQWAEVFRGAAEFHCNWKGLGKDEWGEAGKDMGYSLHPAQDYVAHGDYNRKAEMPSPPVLVGVAHAWHNFDALYWGATLDPDAPNKDALGGPTWTTVTADNGRPVIVLGGSGGMVPGVTLLFGGGTTYWAKYTGGSARLNLTRTISIARLSNFMDFVRQNSKKCGECQKHFLPPDETCL